MNALRTFAAASLLGLACAGPGRAGESARLALQPQSRLWLEGTSTLHAYSSTATRIELAGEAQDASADGLLREGGTRGFAVTIPVSALKSGESGLDKNMYKALKAKEFPAIVFRLSSYQASGGAIKAKGRLTIAGTEKDIELEAQAVPSGDALEVRGRQALLMTDYGIAPPKLMGGLLKTGDKVVIGYDLVLGIEKAGSEKRRLP
ncbi:MAG TPA: YceI family protein [Elusimicrobiota bacterium]|nr:YceI family protein [Elusimicrobiota bacterium]